MWQYSVKNESGMVLVVNEEGIVQVRRGNREDEYKSYLGIRKNMKKYTTGEAEETRWNRASVRGERKYGMDTLTTSQNTI